MPSNVQPQISAGQPLDVQPGVSNIGENQAELDALRNANVDGQDIFPQSVSTRRFSAEDGAFSGNIYAGSMLIGAGGMTITSDPDLGTPNTGLYLDSSVLYLIKDGVATVTLNGTTGDATFTGAIYATSGTFTGDISASTISSMSSVDFGTNVTIGGDLFLNGADFSGKVVFDGATQAAYINWDETIEYLDIRNNRSFGGIGISTAGGTILSLSDELKRIYLAATESLGVDADIDLVIGNTAGSTFKVARGIGTTVMSFVGNSDTVTFAGAIALSGAITGATTINASGSISGAGVCTFGAVETTGSIKVGAGVCKLTGGTAAPAAGDGKVGDMWASTSGSFWFKNTGGWFRLDV